MPDRDVFILGAGFSKAINCRMPTMKELTHQVSKRLEEEGKILPPPLGGLGGNRHRRIEYNVEHWMTFLSEDQPWLTATTNAANRAIAREIRDAIGKVIEDRMWSSMEPAVAPSGGPHTVPKWLSLLTNRWRSSQTSVITLNYDTLVERAIEYDFGVTVQDLYPPYISHISNIRSMDMSQLRTGLSSTFSFFKLHGSINWHYSGRDDFFGEQIYYSQVSPWGAKCGEIEKNSRLLTVDKKPLIIPPVTEKSTYFSNESIRRLWHEASMALKKATRVFVIGYSLPQSDLGMRFFLKQSLPEKGTHWYIVDTDESVIRRYMELVKHSQIVHCKYVAKPDPVVKFASDYDNQRIPTSVKQN